MDTTNKTAEYYMAERYRQYLLGWAYIPIQDLGRFEKAFNQLKRTTV